MDIIKKYFTAKYQHDFRVASMIFMTNTNKFSPLIDGFDVLLLVITHQKEFANSIFHYIKDEYRIQERWIDTAGLEGWIMNGENRSIIQWLLQGDILIDRNEDLETIRGKLWEFDPELREKKLFQQFARFIKKYMQSKEYIQAGHVLDAYSNILEALHHWARIAIIEVGIQPEVTVWQQVRKINPGIYKLYDELTQSEETMEKRIQLVILACEFSMMAKMQECCGILLRVIESRPEPWSVMELRMHPQLEGLRVDLSPMLKKLASKGLIQEITVGNDKKQSIMELNYR